MIKEMARRIATFAVAVAVVLGLALTAAPAAGASTASEAPAVSQVHLSTAAAPLAVAGVLVPTNWFSDWQTCIWGIGVPAALAWRYPAWTKAMASRAASGARGAYATYVVAACERFIRS